MRRMQLRVAFISLMANSCPMQFLGKGERKREGEREREREGGREKEGGRERERGQEGGRERGRERGKKTAQNVIIYIHRIWLPWLTVVLQRRR